MDYYSVLNVEYDVNKEQLRRAYRKKVKLYHPDRCTLPDANIKFIEVQDAYEYLLSNIDKQQVAEKEFRQEKKTSRYNYAERASDIRGGSAAGKTDSQKEKQHSTKNREETIDEVVMNFDSSLSQLSLLIRGFAYLLLAAVGYLLMLKSGVFTAIVFVVSCIAFELLRAMIVNNAQYNLAKR